MSGSAASNVGILTQDNTSQYQNPTSSSSTAAQPSDWCTTGIDHLISLCMYIFVYCTYIFIYSRIIKIKIKIYSNM